VLSYPGAQSLTPTDDVRGVVDSGQDTKPREIGEVIIHSVHVLKGEPKKKIFPSGKILQPLLA
jgi:hypothetical protein